MLLFLFYMSILLYTNSMVYKFYVWTPIIIMLDLLSPLFVCHFLSNLWLVIFHLIFNSLKPVFLLPDWPKKYLFFFSLHSFLWLSKRLLYTPRHTHQFILLFYRQHSIKFKVFFVLLVCKFSRYSFAVWTWVI